MDARRAAIGFARYIRENPNVELGGELIGPLVYRLRVVDNYTSTDVDEICEAMEIIIKQLIDLPPVAFAPDVWMPLMVAITEGGIDPSFKAMMETVDVETIQLLCEPHGVYSDDEVDETLFEQSPSTKSCEQITSICKGHVLKHGLTRRVFSAIWDTNFEETMQKMIDQKWNLVKLKVSNESSSQASFLLERNVFDVFSEMKDHGMFAKELYYASLARILKPLQAYKKPEPPKEKPETDDIYEDLSAFESSFQIYDEVVKKMWPYLSSNNEDVKKSTMHIFEELFRLSSTDVLVQRISERFIDTCGWLKIRSDEICEAIEPCLWTVIKSLVTRLLQLRRNIPCEVEFIPDDFDAIATGGLGDNQKEMYMRAMLNLTSRCLLCLLKHLRYSRNSELVAEFMMNSYQRIVENREAVIMFAAVDMFKSSMSHGSITSEQILSIVNSLINTPAIASIVYILSGIEDIGTAKAVIETVLAKLASDLKDDDQKKEDLVNHIHESGTLWKCVGKVADRDILNKGALRFAQVAIDSVETRKATLAVDIFLTLVKLELTSDAEKLPGKSVTCNATFKKWEMKESTWKTIGDNLIECNMSKRNSKTAIPLFTLHQLQSIDELTMRDLIYVVTQMKYLKTTDGIETHRMFYEGYPKISKILETFQSLEHKTALCLRLIEEFAKVISTNEKTNLIFNMDHENILEWFEEIGVLDCKGITEKLIELCFAVEVWDILVLLQLDGSECEFDDLQTFGRFWKTPFMERIKAGRQKEIDEQVGSLLKRYHDKLERKRRSSREKRVNAKFPTRQNTDEWESRILLMHNRIAEYLAKKKVEEFADESTVKFTWLLGVCSGQTTYEEDAFNDAKLILARLYPDGAKREQLLYNFSVSSVLHGIGKTAELKGKINLRDIFMSVYTEIVIADMRTWKEEDSPETINKRMGGFIEWLEDSSSEKVRKDNGIRLSLISQLTHHVWFQLKTMDIAEWDNLQPDQVQLTVRKFAEVIASRMHCITNWLLPLPRPFSSAAKLENLIEIVFHFPDIVSLHRKPIEQCLQGIFNILILPEYQYGLLNHGGFKIQFTEKYQSSSLNCKRESFSKEPHQNKIFRVTDILKIFCKYGTENVQIHCLQKIRDALKTMPQRILQFEEILRGNQKIEKNLQKRVVCDVELLSELIGYYNCFHKQLLKADLEMNPPETPDEKPEERVLNTFMLLETSSHSKSETSKKSNPSGTPRNQSDQIDLNYCTFKSTGDKFTNQHWYNCYTCNMMEQTGVCSTCAVNCHRGHDIAYSKKGQFFCDCGSQDCMAMVSNLYYPNPMNAVRGQLPGETVEKTSPKSKDVFEYSFGILKTNDESNKQKPREIPNFENLKKALQPVQEEFEKVQKDLEKILEAIDFANQKALQVTEKQKAVVKSLENMETVVVEDSYHFMEPLDADFYSGHFLPIRRVDVLVQERNLNSHPRRRELADVIKLDNGTELLVMIPDCIQTCLQLHYMDTRTNLILGMHCLRTETEQIPFNAISLNVSGNRVVVCGVYEIYALRFSPQGTVIDRAHIKLLENGNTSSMQNNPVKKARFCREMDWDKKRKQLIAVATMQYIRIYDLTLHETNFVEEMVLPTGNVEDVLIFNQENGNIRVLVLASSGYLYEHIVTNGAADNNSIFITNVVHTPGADRFGDGVSLHYSHTFNLLFVSLDSILLTAHLPEPASGNSVAPIYDWKMLCVKYPVDVWREASGIISCLPKENTDQVVYFYPSLDKISIQKSTVKRPIMTYFLLTSSKNQAIYSVLIYPDLPTCEIWETKWNFIPDLWIGDVPSERFAVDVLEQKCAPRPLDKEDLVLMAEQCEPMTAVDWSCRDIEMFYTHTDLNRRLLSADPMAITIVQQTHFTLSARVTNSRQVVRMIRVEVEGVNGPDSLKIGGCRYSIATRTPKAFDLKLSREESLSMDHKDITIEVIPKPAHNTVKLKSLKLYGCDRSAMDEIQPKYERQPVLSTPNRLTYAILEFPVLMEWKKEMARKHLSRKLNHPSICAESTKTIVKCYPNADEELFKIIDGAYLKEWKALKYWTDRDGFAEMRMNHVEHLIERLEAVRTRWSYFHKTLEEEFGTVTSFVELMRDEMTKMPLHRCQLMAQAIVKVVFGLLSFGSEESEDLVRVFLDIFTDQNTYHLANDLRSAVQETISRYENSMKQEKTLIASGKELIRIQHPGFTPFYGIPRIMESSPEALLIAKVNGTIPLESGEDIHWLDQLMSMIIDKLFHSKVTPTWQNISDSPPYNLSRVLASCIAICDPKIIKIHFTRLIRSIVYDVNQILPLGESSYSNYSMLRCVELLLCVCLEKKGEENKEHVEMLDAIVRELHLGEINDLCFKVLEKVLPLWKERGPSTFTRNSAESRKVWLPHVPLVSSSANPPNTSVMNWPANSEDAFTISCTDLVLLIPQHLQEIDRKKNIPRDDFWIQKLCALSTLSAGCSAYRQCKKLLLAICNGDEAKYKVLKDKYKMLDLLQQLIQKYLEVSKQVGGHQQLTDIVDILASISRLALIRPDMWRDVCTHHATWLLRLACYCTDVVASQVVELLIVAVRDSSIGGQMNIQLADTIIESENGEFIEKIIRRFLIGKDEQLRWTLHGMLRSIIQFASRTNQVVIVKKLYQTIYPTVEDLGVQGAQLVDLIATYAPRVFGSSELAFMTLSEITRIQNVAEKLEKDGYYGMYKQMSALGLGWKSIQFDRNPCLVCFNSKGSHDMVKMHSIKSEVRWSTHTIFYKLMSNYEISKITLKLSEIKKSKSIRKISLYYCAKSMESVELKLHPEFWRKCASVNLAENETTVNMPLAVPVVTSSLIIELDEILDLRPVGPLHCPRCSGAVRSHSGVCDSCGENAFQCIKCRAINYVEKEPFLCSSCGYSKYVRIEAFAACRPLPGAQHITCDAERGQCVQEISQLLTKMETTKTKLTGYRAVCESLYIKHRPLPLYKLHVENNHAAEFFETNGTMSVEQLAFQSITQPMNNLAISIRTLHAELCQQTQQLMYLHDELNRYDYASEVSVIFHKPQNISYYTTSESCFGCLCNQLLHALALVHSCCDDENALNLILSASATIKQLGNMAQTYEPLREEIEELLVKLMFGRTDVTMKIERLIESGDVNLSVMVKSLMYAADPTWQQKLKLLIRFAVEKRDESCSLQALMVLNKYLEATKSVPLDERKKVQLAKNTRVAMWLTTDETWKECSAEPSTSTAPLLPPSPNRFHWISDCLFSEWMSVRAAANTLLVNISRQIYHEPFALLKLCESLAKLKSTPTTVCDQFMTACHSIVDLSVNTKTRLFAQQFHVYLIRKIHEECATLHNKKCSLSSDNAFGEKLRCFVELLNLLLSGSNVENIHLKAGADDLLIFLLHSTIFLKRMMTRRTKAIDSSRNALEKLLKRVSCRDGTKLMTVCVESLKLVQDAATRGIIVGVMMEIMNPQQETEESFLIQIEKDVAQEDFLQGRMTHNPYNSNDAGMGPLMRDIKNKICRDTEMIALMEDDNGMELLVNGNIISLSLSVREVYDRLWKRTNNGAPMMIVYRMRGLMGDAVETFIENFGVAESSGEDGQEDEQLVRMIHVLAQCGGIDELMSLLETSVDASSGRFLLSQLRKLFERIVKTPIGRRSLIERKMVERMMSVVRTCCIDPINESKVQIGMELYKVVEFVVSDKQVQDILCGIRKEDATWFFDLFEKRGYNEGSVTEIHRKTAQIIDSMTSNIGNVVTGSDEAENVLVGMYSRVMNWEVMDAGVPASDLQARHRISRRDQTIMMTEQLANITTNILPTTFGIRLKQKILDSGVIATTCQYLMKDLPNLYQPTESPEWKTFLSKPSLKLILTLLAGLSRGHQAAQKEIAKSTLKLMHRLEQVASDNSIGTLAENVIEALTEDAEVKEQIKIVRDETEKKKKQLAMINREKQLQKMRMKVGTGGQITVSSRTLHNEPSIDETDSLACCICRESVIRGNHASGVYAFAAVDQETGRTGTVSMMVMVHLKCHKDAIRGNGGGRAADEWTRSKLHNAGAKCNVITPIATGTMSDTAWAEIVHRFETDLGRVSGLAHGVVNRNFVFCDICKLIDRFIYKRSFSNQSEGGGRDSNMQYLAILHLLGISIPTHDVELEISAPNHRLIAFLFTELTAESWNDQKNDVLRAALNDAQTSGGEATWQGFKPTLMTWAFVDSYFNKVIKITGEDRLEWLREHLVETINKTLKFVEDFDSNVLPCDDVAEFCDVTGALFDEVNMFLNVAQ